MAAEKAYPNLLAMWQQERSKVHFMVQPTFVAPFGIVVNDTVTAEKSLGPAHGYTAELRWYKQREVEMPLLRTGLCWSEEDALRALGRMAGERRKARK